MTSPVNASVLVAHAKAVIASSKNLFRDSCGGNEGLLCARACVKLSIESNMLNKVFDSVDLNEKTAVDLDGLQRIRLGFEKTVAKLIKDGDNDVNSTYVRNAFTTAMEYVNRVINNLSIPGASCYNFNDISTPKKLSYAQVVKLWHDPNVHLPRSAPTSNTIRPLVPKPFAAPRKTKQSVKRNLMNSFFAEIQPAPVKEEEDVPTTDAEFAKLMEDMDVPDLVTVSSDDEEDLQKAVKLSLTDVPEVPPPVKVKLPTMTIPLSKAKAPKTTAVKTEEPAQTKPANVTDFNYAIKELNKRDGGIRKLSNTQAAMQMETDRKFSNIAKAMSFTDKKVNTIANKLDSLANDIAASNTRVERMMSMMRAGLAQGQATADAQQAAAFQPAQPFHFQPQDNQPQDNQFQFQGQDGQDFNQYPDYEEGEIAPDMNNGMGGGMGGVDVMNMGAGMINGDGMHSAGDRPAHVALPDIPSHVKPPAFPKYTKGTTNLHTHFSMLERYFRLARIPENLFIDYAIMSLPQIVTWWDMHSVRCADQVTWSFFKESVKAYLMGEKSTNTALSKLLALKQGSQSATRFCQQFMNLVHESHTDPAEKWLVSHMLLGFTDSNLRRTLSSNKGTAWTSVTELVQYLATIMAYEVHSTHNKHASHKSATTHKRPNKFAGQKRAYDGMGQQQQPRRRQFGQPQQPNRQFNGGRQPNQPNRQFNNTGAAPGQNPPRAQFQARNNNNAGPQLNAGQGQFNNNVQANGQVNPQVNAVAARNNGNGQRYEPAPGETYCHICRKHTHMTAACSIFNRQFNNTN